MLKNDERGIVGIALLGLVLVATIVGAGFYVYQARSDQTTSVDSGSGVKPKPAKEIKADADAAAADSAARAAESEDLNDIGVSDKDF